jgi:plastocyanin
MRTRYLRTFLLTTCLAASALSLPAAPPAAAATVDVSVSSNFFNQANVTIGVGDTVHWVWQSGPHSTTSVTGQTENWDSGEHSPQFSFNHTFTHTGVFVYYCSVHGFDNGDGTAGGMKGTVTVAATVDRTGTYIGTRQPRQGGAPSPFAIQIHEIQGTMVHGTVSTDGVNFTDVMGTLSATGALKFVEKSGSGRRLVKTTTKGQFSASQLTITGTRKSKRGSRVTANETFTITKEEEG